MTLKEVAALADCSVATVCKAFKNSNEISSLTKQRVLQAAKQCGYLQKATTRTAVLGGLKVVLLCDPNGRLQAKAAAIMSDLQRGGYSAVYTVLNPNTALELMLQVGAVGMVCVAENAPEHSRVFTQLQGEPEVEQWLEFLNSLGGVARKRRTGQSRAQRQKQPAEVPVPNEKPEPPRDEIWLL